MSVNISGAVLSSLFYEQNNADGDNEGLLLGKVVNHVTDTISDSQINNVKEENITYVYSFVPCIGLFNWYNSSGRVDQERLMDLFQTVKGTNGQHREVVGWYKFRRNSSFIMSMRERAIHRHLKECFPGLNMNNFLFCLCTSNTAQNHGIHSFDHTFFINNGRTFQGLPVQVENLGDTAQSQSEYRAHGSKTVNPNTGIFNKTVQNFSSEMLDARGKLQSVVSFQNLNEVLHQQLMGLCEQVAETETYRAKLMKEVDDLETRSNALAMPEVNYPHMNVSPEFEVPPDNHVNFPVESATARRLVLTGPIPVPTQSSSPLLPRKTTYHQKSPLRHELPEPEHEQLDLIVLDDEVEDRVKEEKDTPEWKPLKFPGTVEQLAKVSSNDSISSLNSSESSMEDPVDRVRNVQNQGQVLRPTHALNISAPNTSELPSAQRDTKEIKRDLDSFHDLVHSAKSELIHSNSVEHQSRSSSVDSEAGDAAVGGARKKTKSHKPKNDKRPKRHTRAKKVVQQNKVEEMDFEPSSSPSY